MNLAGFTSTGSKRPGALFGGEADGVPLRMSRSLGCRIWDDQGREYLDFISGLGAVGLGYGHPEVIKAAEEALRRGGIGPLAPVEEEQLAGELAAAIPRLEQVRFLKTGAEAVAAAVRLSRVHTGRDLVLGCGYHGWLDWSSREAGVPETTRALYNEIPFNNVERSVELIRAAGGRLACVVLEPVVEAAPDAAWLRAVREETRNTGALLVFDEIKTALRVHPECAATRWGGDPDLLVLGKAIASGFPLAAVGGRAEIMAGVSKTWISSTMATEFVSLAAARATLRIAREHKLSEHLHTVGTALYQGLGRLARAHPAQIGDVGGIPELCYLRFVDDRISANVARECARRGLLFKRSAYNFVNLSHGPADVESALGILDEVLRTVR